MCGKLVEVILNFFTLHICITKRSRKQYSSQHRLMKILIIFVATLFTTSTGTIHPNTILVFSNPSFIINEKDWYFVGGITLPIVFKNRNWLKCLFFDHMVADHNLGRHPPGWYLKVSSCGQLDLYTPPILFVVFKHILYPLPRYQLLRVNGFDDLWW